MKSAFLIAALISALILSGCVQSFPDLSNTDMASVPSDQETQPPDNQQQGNQQPISQSQDQNQFVQCPDGSLAVSPDLCIGSGEAPPVNPVVESCGSIDITNLAMATGSAEEKANLSCFNQNMASCSNSSFELTGQFGGIFSVLGEEEENCLISYYDNTDLSQKTCQFPKTFLESSVQSAELAGQPELPLILVSAGMTSKELQNSQTGETIEIVCS